MIIKHKGIWHERFEDAPFVGALVVAINCKYNCKNCFNQHLKDNKIIENTEKEIIEKIKMNVFNKGIILGGLEWTFQPEEMKSLTYQALNDSLKVMLYTGLNEEDFKKSFYDIYSLPIYIKFGKYDEKNKVNNYYMYDVKLASSNQYIRYNNIA